MEPHSVANWKKIIEKVRGVTATEDGPTAIARRMLGDLVGYNHPSGNLDTRRRRERDLERDAQELRNAIVAYAERYYELATQPAETLICGACGLPWTGQKCGQADNGWPFETCYPVPRPASWTEAEYPGDAVRSQLIRRGDEIGDIRIQDHGNVTDGLRYTVGLYLPGIVECPPGDTPKTWPNESFRSGTVADANKAFDLYLAMVKLGGWTECEREHSVVAAVNAGGKPGDVPTFVPPGTPHTGPRDERGQLK